MYVQIKPDGLITLRQSAVIEQTDHLTTSSAYIAAGRQGSTARGIVCRRRHRSISTKAGECGRFAGLRILGAETTGEQAAFQCHQKAGSVRM